MLLLLLVSLQAYAGVCHVHCGVIGLSTARASAPAMASCRTSSAVLTAHPPKAFFSHERSCNKLCQSDLQLLQSRIDHPVDAQLSAGDRMSPMDVRALLIGYTRPGCFNVERSRQAKAPFAPLISNLRI